MTDETFNLRAQEPVAQKTGDGALGPGQEPAPPRLLSEAARRALAEAEERRARRQEVDLPQEVNGRGGAEPIRFGDWEKGGLISDF